MFLGGVHTRGSTASSIFHGRIQLDACGRSSALEQSGCRQSKWGPAHEVLLSHRLGYKNQQDKQAKQTLFSLWVLIFSLLSFVDLLSDPAGLPVLIVTITLASASGKYSADGYCWLSVQDGVIWGFAGPVIFIIMVRKLKAHFICWKQNSWFYFCEQPVRDFFPPYYFQRFENEVWFVCVCWPNVTIKLTNACMWGCKFYSW